MQKYISVWIFFTTSLVLAEENPFLLKERFRILDKTEHQFFDTMQQELKKDKVKPAIIHIPFEEHNHSRDIPKQPQSSFVPKTLIPVKKIKEVSVKKPIKNLQNQARINHLIDKALEAQNKRKKIRETQKARVKERAKQRFNQWMEKHTVKIDLIQEKNQFKRLLDVQYKKAVKEVGKPR